jgi:hypothetical protein
MGSGQWSPATYNDRVVARTTAGKDTFAYSSDAVKTGQMKPHQTLDPQGLGIRESRDSAEHPDSNSIIISLDVTGSMGAVCRAIHADLPKLHELLLGHKYIADPQIMFTAIGDATCDKVPVQVGQFESDNRMDQNLENMILEGGGGGQKTESYELTFYIAARHTGIDCWDKRKRKGYLFIIGDEMAYPAVKAREVNHLFGKELQADIPLEQIIEEAQQRYHIYYLIPGCASYGTNQEIFGWWNRQLGPGRVIKLETPEDTSECIGLTIGINEGAINMADGVAQMQSKGVVARAVDRISQALGGLVPTGPTVTSKRSRRL